MTFLQTLAQFKGLVLLELDAIEKMELAEAAQAAHLDFDEKFAEMQLVSVEAEEVCVSIQAQRDKHGFVVGWLPPAPQPAPQPDPQPAPLPMTQSEPRRAQRDKHGFVVGWPLPAPLPSLPASVFSPPLPLLAPQPAPLPAPQPMPLLAPPPVSQSEPLPAPLSVPAQTKASAKDVKKRFQIHFGGEFIPDANGKWQPKKRACTGDGDKGDAAVGEARDRADADEDDDDDEYEEQSDDSDESCIVSDNEEPEVNSTASDSDNPTPPASCFADGSKETRAQRKAVIRSLSKCIAEALSSGNMLHIDRYVEAVIFDQSRISFGDHLEPQIKNLREVFDLAKIGRVAVKRQKHATRTKCCMCGKTKSCIFTVTIGSKTASCGSSCFEKLEIVLDAARFLASIKTQPRTQAAQQLLESKWTSIDTKLDSLLSLSEDE